MWQASSLRTPGQANGGSSYPMRVTRVARPARCFDGGFKTRSPGAAKISLPGLQNGCAKVTRGRLYATFSPSWSSSFFHNFSNTLFFSPRFWLHPGSQNGSLIHQKSVKNQSKNLIEKLHSFSIVFSSIFDGFGTQLNLKKKQKRFERCHVSCFC